MCRVFRKADPLFFPTSVLPVRQLMKRGRRFSDWVAIIYALSVCVRGNGAPMNVFTMANDASTLGYADGLAPDATFNFPTGVATAVLTDGTETVFVADTYNGRIRRIDFLQEYKGASVFTLAGSSAQAALDGIGTSAGLKFPYGITATATKLYVTQLGDPATPGDGKIRTIDITVEGYGQVTSHHLVFDSSGLSQATCCNGINGAIYEGELYMASPKSNQIVAIKLNDFKVRRTAGSGVPGYQDGNVDDSTFDQPYGIALAQNPDGLIIYVADTNNHLIRQIGPLSKSKNDVTTIAGNRPSNGAGGMEDGVGTNARLNKPLGIALDPNGERLLFIDQANNALREYRIVGPDQGLVRTLVRDLVQTVSSGVTYAYGLALSITKDSANGAVAIVTTRARNRILSVGKCDLTVCAMDFWRAPCNVDFLGRCIACTKSINGTITKAAEPYTEDKCEWQCSVGFWQFDKTVCTQGDRLCNKCKPCTRKLPPNAAFSTNGGDTDSCKWSCNTGYELNAKEDACVYIPLSRCFKSEVQVDEGVKGSYCQGLNFTLKGCARNAQHHEAITLAMAQWMDGYYKRDGMCDELLTTGPAQLYKDLKHYLQVESGKQGAALSVPSDNIKQPIPQVDEQVKRQAEQADVLIVPGKKSNNTAAFTGLCSLSSGVPVGSKDTKPPPISRCRSLCPLREVWVQAVLGSCNADKDCPSGTNTSKFLCCFALTKMTELSCQDFNQRAVGKYASTAQVPGLCNSIADCTQDISSARSIRTHALTYAGIRSTLATSILISYFSLLLGSSLSSAQ